MGRRCSMENWEVEGYFLLYFRFEICELGAINTELMASKLTPEHYTPFEVTVFYETNQFVLWREWGHWAFCRLQESSRNPLMCLFTGCHLWQVKKQQVPIFISLTGASEHEAIPEAHHFTGTLCSKVSKYSASVCCDKGRCPLMTMLLAWHWEFLGSLTCLPSERFLYFKNHFHYLWFFPFSHV